MKSKSAILSLILLLLLMVSAAHDARADYKLVMAVHVDGYQNQGQTVPARDDTSIIWISPGGARIDQADTASFIFLADKASMVMLDHREKKFMEVPMNAMAKLIEQQAAGDSTKMAQAKQMMEMMRMKAKVTPTGETKMFGKWNCTKYLLSVEIAMTTTSTECWVTKDIPIDYALYAKVTQAMKAFLPGYEDALKEMKKMEGVQVHSVTTASYQNINMRTVTDLVSAVETPVSKDMLAVPAGYTQSEVQLPGMHH